MDPRRNLQRALRYLFLDEFFSLIDHLAFRVTVFFIKQYVAYQKPILTFDGLWSLLILDLCQFAQRDLSSRWCGYKDLLQLLWAVTPCSGQSDPYIIPLAAFHGFSHCTTAHTSLNIVLHILDGQTVTGDFRSFDIHHR